MAGDRRIAEGDAQWTVAPVTGSAPYPPVQRSQPVPEEDRRFLSVGERQAGTHAVTTWLAVLLGASFCRRGKRARAWISWQVFQ